MNQELLWSYCAKCQQETKHNALFKKECEDQTFYTANEYFVEGITIFLVLECNGCEEISFRKDYRDFMNWYPEGECGDEEDNIPENERYILKSAIYPNQLQNHNILEPLYFLPEKIRNVYEQTILSLKGDSKLLAGVGFRAIIEAICIEENIKGNDLAQKINNLVKNKLITEKESDRLHSIRFLGNDSVHEIEIPSQKQLYLVLNIIEHLLKNLYILDKSTQNVLDTIIKEYDDFECLLINLIVRKAKVGDIRTLKEILGKHRRRIISDLSGLEVSLIEKIKQGKMEHLAIHIGNVEEIKYLVASVEDPLPF